MKYPIANTKINKAMLSTALSLTIAFSAGTMFFGHDAAFAAAKTDAIQTKISDNAAKSIADDVIATGKKFLGVPYLFGAASDRTDAFDCSSFTQYMFKQSGIHIPRSSRDQSKAGVYVPKSDLQPGDLVFSDTNRDGVINHVSLYIGNDKLLHTYRVGIGVTISDFKGSTWDKTYVTARRVIPADASSGNEQTQTDNKTSNGKDSAQNAGDRIDTGKADNGSTNRLTWTRPSFGESYRNYR